MEEKNLKFGQLHIIIQGILIAIAALYSVDLLTTVYVPGLIVLGLCTLVDIFVLPVAKANRNKLLIVVRVPELLLISALIVFMPTSVDNLQIMGYLIIMVRMLELVYLFDYSDAYLRIITIGFIIFPLTIMILVELLFDQQRNPGNITSLGVVAVLTAVVIIVGKISDIFSSWINKVEQHMYDQRRVAENASEMNETLRIHQEKIRKANEELGIQRIRTESVNRLINKANTEMNTQNEILKQLTTCHDIPSLAKSIPETMCKNLDKLMFCAIVLVNRERHYELAFGIECPGMTDEFKTSYKDVAFSEFLKDGTSREISLDKELSNDCYTLTNQGKALQVVAARPLYKENEKIGLILCGSNIKDYFEESMGLLETVITQLILGLKNIELYSEIQRMAITDGLTGLYNRRKLNELIEAYSREVVENQISLSVAMLDIDHFKIFNDTYGHACGDMVLKELAGILDRWSTEYCGIAARYGGEEFVLAFMNCDQERIKEILSRVKHEIDNMICFYEGNRITIRVSMGYSCYPETLTNVNRILNNADAALYYSKEHGRNRITADCPEVLQYIEEREKTGKK